MSPGCNILIATDVAQRGLDIKDVAYVVNYVWSPGCHALAIIGLCGFLFPKVFCGVLSQFPKQFAVGFSLRRKKAGRDMLWSRPWSLSAMCPPCVRLDSALAASPHFVGHVSAVCPPCIRLECASKPLSAMCPPCVRLVSSMCPPCVCLQTLYAICPPCDRQLRSTMHPRLWTLSARGLLWGRAVAS